MYLLDYKVNKELSKIRDKLSEQFIDWLETKEQVKEGEVIYWISKERVNLTKHKKELAINAVGCFVSNVAFRLRFKKTTIAIPRYKNLYSQPLIYNGQKVPRLVSYTYTMLLCEFIKHHYWCIESKGCVLWELDKRHLVKTGEALMTKKEWHTTQYKLTDELVSMFDGCNLIADRSMSVIEIRDKSGKVISKKLTDKQKHMVNILTKINNKYQTGNICLDDDILDFQLKKVYNHGSFELGGRNYMVGSDANKAMKRTNRLKITINGEPCVELDYKSMFPSMIADMNGVTFPESFDPYAIELDGCDRELLRDLAKLACLMLLNTDDMKSAQYALASTLAEDEWKCRVEEAKKAGMWPEGRIVHTIVEKLIERNGYLMHECDSRNALKYMNYESEINDIILESLLMEDIIVIPLHDSFIVPIRAEQRTRYHMERAYKLVIGGNNCRITSKVAEC
jgi:hypothetical protein